MPGSVQELAAPYPEAVRGPAKRWCPCSALVPVILRAVMPLRLRCLTFAALALLACASLRAAAEDGPPDMVKVVARFEADETSLRRFYSEPLSSFRLARLQRFLEGWRERLAGIEGTALDLDGAIDLALLRNHVARRLDELRLQRARNAQLEPGRTLAVAARRGRTRARRHPGAPALALNA